jgi:hypothetical protein
VRVSVVAEYSAASAITPMHSLPRTVLIVRCQLRAR